MTYYVYRQSERGAWTVGSYDGSDEWNPESNHSSVKSAIDRLNFLNEGGVVAPDPKEAFALTRFDRLLEAAFQGILANPEFAELSQTQVAEMSIQHTKVLMDLLDEQKI